MFSGHTHLLPTISNYTQARKYWDKTKKPRTAKWADNQRPLKDARSLHYRIETDNPDQYFDICLYGTTMGRLYAPDAEGNERRLYRGVDTTTSHKFMFDVLLRRSYTHTTDGRNATAPVYNTPFLKLMEEPSKDFSADYWFTPDNKLIVEKSRHTRHWRKVSDENDKAIRVQMRTRWEPFLMLAAFRMPEFINEIALSNSLGRAFGGYVPNWETKKLLKEMDAALQLDQMPTDAQASNFFTMCQKVFNVLASKRAAKQDDFKLSSYWQKPEDCSKYEELERTVTADDLSKSVLNKLQEVLELNKRSKWVELPQFMNYEDYPRSNVFVRENP